MLELDKIHGFIDKSIKKNDVVVIPPDIDEILNSDIVRINDSNGSGIGSELKEIAKELTSDRNVFRFSNADKHTLTYDSLLGAIGDKPYYDKNVKPRYSFIQSFRVNYAINRSAIKSEQANRFKDLGSSLLGFKAMLEYRQAGISNPLEDEKKHSLLDKLKKG